MNKTVSWSFEHAGLPVTVKHWGVELGEFGAMNNGKGAWNYYVSIPERLCPSRFHELWLPDKLVKWGDTSPECIMHDYKSAPFANVDWHGGITYYAKHGQVEGHRTVELGCDYNHLFDSERGFPYSLVDVTNDAKQTAEELAKMYL